MKKLFIIAAAMVVLMGVGGALLVGSELSAPALRVVGAAPSDLHAVDVQFGGVRGWFVSAGDEAPCVLLMHGVRSDRRGMIDRARMLRKAGYSSLLFDFQAHGESPGQHITFGHLESQNAQAAVQLLREKFMCSKVAAIGQSLGGAAALLGDGPIAVDALILESVYPTIEEAIADRLRIRLGKVGEYLSPILMFQLKPRLGVDATQLRPIGRIGAFHHPLLIAGGTEDQHTSMTETLRLYAAANEPKQLWAVRDAAHVDLEHFDRAAYGKKVLTFLSTYMPTPSNTMGQTR